MRSVFSSLSSSSSSSVYLPSKTYLFLRSSPSVLPLFRSRFLVFSPCSVSISHLIMPRGGGGHGQQRWKPKVSSNEPSSSGQSAAALMNRVDGLSVAEAETSAPSALQFGNVQMLNQGNFQGQKAIWKPKAYGTVAGASTVEVEQMPSRGTAAEVQNKPGTPKSSVNLSKFFKGNVLENFVVDNSTIAEAKIRAMFYPKFENEKSDQEIRTRMIEMVSKGLATIEVSLKHSGSLFMYAGNKGGAYAKNSFGNIKGTKFQCCQEDKILTI